jgi:isochorismate hydrolase
MPKIEGYLAPGNLAAKTRLWLKKIARYNAQKMALQPGRSWLLVIDMRRYCADPEGAPCLPSAQAILANLRRLINVFRTAKIPVIYTSLVHHPGGLDLGILGKR